MIEHLSVYKRMGEGNGVNTISYNWWSLVRLYVKISQAMAADVFILEILLFLHLTTFNPQSHP